MGYRGNLGCLWLLLLAFVIGGAPLLMGVLRLFVSFVVMAGLAGLAASWWLRKRAIGYYTSTQSEHHNHFVQLLVTLLMRLAHLDGTLDRREVAAIRNFFERELGYKDERLLWLRDVMKESMRSSATVEAVCAEIAAGYGLNERLIALRVMTAVAQADGHVTAGETEFIARVAELLGLGAFRSGFAGGPAGPSRSQQLAEALGTLGLGAQASAEEVKQAWRKLSMENHPDRAAHLGEEFRHVAEQQMRKINGAYEVLKQAGRA
ncbi:MAG: molecular chaperone DjiA [Deltaproteobacteria bacterium]